MFKSLVEGKNICAVIHRRAGKDIFCIQAWLMRGLQRVGTHVYLFPLFTQARSVIWNGMDFDGRPFISAIPDSLISKKNEARMEITLFNGSRLILAGSNNYDSLMGSNPITIIYSEFSLHNPLARQHLDPILIQNKGMEILQFTPRGMNHGYEVYNMIRENPDYHVEHLSVEQTFKSDGVTRIITAEDIIKAKARGMSEEMIRQEFYVDFEVGNLGAYYTREMANMVRDGRITTILPDQRLSLHSVWDLGGTDATAGIIFQVTGRYIHIVHVLHDTGKGFRHYLEMADRYRQSVGCEWGNHFGPHDIDQKHQGWEHTESRLMQARKHGWQFQVVPKVNLEDGIEAARVLFDNCRIDQNNCSILIRALREYQRNYNETKACFEPKPFDNWSTHLADAFRYLGVQYKRLYAIPQPPGSYQSSL